MGDQINRWTVLIFVLALLFGYAFALVNMKVFEPAMTARMAGNQQIVQQVNQMAKTIDANFGKYNQGIQARFAQQDARIKALEARK